MVFDAQGGYRRMQLRIRGAGFAVYRPGVYEIGLIGPMGSWIDMPILCGRDICVLATMFGNIPRAMRSATALPPATPSSPPSQKVGCTSTTINAFVMFCSYPV